MDRQTDRQMDRGQNHRKGKNVSASVRLIPFFPFRVEDQSEGNRQTDRHREPVRQDRCKDRQTHEEADRQILRPTNWRTGALSFGNLDSHKFLKNYTPPGFPYAQPYFRHN